MAKEEKSEFEIPKVEPPKNGGSIDTSNIPKFQNPNTSSNVEKVAKEESSKINLVNPNQTKAIQPSEIGEAVEKTKAREKLAKMRSHRHFKTIRFAVICFVVFLLIFNFQLIYSQISFWLTPKQPSVSQQIQPTTNEPVNTTAPAEVVGPENLLIIPKINVRAPIIYIDSLAEADVLRALQDGVVHYAGTANPGENGNAVFFGHSSNDLWQPGNYKFVFVLLEKLTVGDTYEIHYQSRRYVYKVVETKVVQPTDLSVLTQTATPFSTLITCTPPGTSWRRFIVKGEQILPATTPTPAQTATTTTPVTPTPAQESTLPGAAPSILEQIQMFFGGLFSRFFGGGNSQNQSSSTSNTTPNRLPESF